MINQVTLMGRLGKDPEIRNTQGDGKVATFSVATSESWKDKRTGERQERTQWHNVVVWNEGLVGVVDKYLRKGDLVFLQGQLETRKWQDKNGADRWTTEVVLRAFGGTLKLMPKGDAKEGGGRDGRRDEGERDSRRDDRGRGDDRGGGGRRSTAEDLDDDIPF